MDSSKQMDAGSAQSQQDGNAPQADQSLQPNPKINAVRQAGEDNTTSSQMQAKLFTDWASI
ncbi:MAG: hypothetical protein WA822_11655 [Albidovulum sp.]